MAGGVLTVDYATADGSAQAGVDYTAASGTLHRPGQHSDTSPEVRQATCRCYDDPDARHGPYHYWTRKVGGKTVGLNLTEDELVLYREWIENNRELERLVKEMRHISSRVLALITGRRTS